MDDEHTELLDNQITTQKIEGARVVTIAHRTREGRNNSKLIKFLDNLGCKVSTPQAGKEKPRDMPRWITIVLRKAIKNK